MFNKSEITTEMDLYFKEQVDSRNYVKINLNEARQDNHVLHFVGYNFIVSTTSSSTTVRMTTDSSIKKNPASASTRSPNQLPEIYPASVEF